MAELAKYIRIYDPAPGDDAVNKRQAALSAAIVQLRKIGTIPALVELGDATARMFKDLVAPDPLGSIVAAAVKKQASAFVRDDHELETTVLSGATMVTLLETSDGSAQLTKNDIIAACVWSALSYQPPVAEPKLEQLRQDLLSVARERVLQRAEVSRKRSVPPKIPEVAEGDPAQITSAFGLASSAVDSLVINASIDREELDMLWWALGSRSPVTGEPYANLEPAVRGVVRGIELGIQLRRVPAAAHRNLALTGVEETAPFTLSAFLGKLAGLRDQLVSRMPAKETILGHPAVFPLLSGIMTGEISQGDREASVEDWSARAVLEAGLASLCEEPSPRL